MAKFFGRIGYVLTEETAPGVWSPVSKTREYYGDIVRNSRRFDQGSNVNDDISMGNEISILADPFAFSNLAMMKWVEFFGAKWKITGVEINYPRITIRFGGVYNAADEEAGASPVVDGSDWE